jgi:hypothetical protein
MVLNAFKASFGLLLAILTIGVLLPYLISAASTELVLIGIFGASLIAFFGMFYFVSQVKNILTGEKNV